MTTTTIFSHTSAISDPGWQTYHHRVRVDPQDLISVPSRTGQIKVTFYVDTGTSAGQLDAAWIGEDGTGNTYNFDGNQVQLRFGGSTSKSGLNGATTFVSDLVNFPYDPAKALIVSMRWSGTAVNTLSGYVPNFSSTSYYSATNDPAATTPATMTAYAPVLFITSISFVTSDIGWLVADSVPACRPRRIIRATNPTEFIGPPPAATTVPYGWLSSADTQVRRRVVQNRRLDEIVVPICPSVISPDVYDWPVDEFPRRQRKRPVYIDGDTAWSVLLPIPPPPSFGWSGTDYWATPRSVIGRLDEAMWVAQPAISITGWLPDEPTALANKRAILLDPYPVGQLPLPPTETPNVAGWFDLHLPVRQRHLPGRFDAQSVGWLGVPPAPTPDIIGWLDISRPTVPRRRQPWLDARSVGGFPVPPAATPDVSGWFDTSLPLSRSRRAAYALSEPAFIGVLSSTASIAVIEDADAAAFVEVTSSDGSLVSVEASDAAALTCSVAWQAVISVGEGSDQCEVVGLLSAFGPLDATDDFDLLSSSVFVIQPGGLAAVEEYDTGAFVVSIVSSSNFAAVEAGDSAVAAGQVTSNSLVAAEDIDTGVVAALVGWGIVLAAIEVADGLAAVGGTAWYATIATSESEEQAAFNCVLSYSATIDASEASDSAAHAGIVGWGVSFAAIEDTEEAFASGSAAWSVLLAALDSQDVAALVGGIGSITFLESVESNDLFTAAGKRIALVWDPFMIYEECE